MSSPAFDMSLESCLPPTLRGASTTIVRMSYGLSGAGVHRVTAGEDTFVLKITAPDEPLADWRRKLAIQRAAADAGLAPAIVHVDEAQRAVVTAFVADHSFFAIHANPRSRPRASSMLGEMVRRVHTLPIPSAGGRRSPHEYLGSIWQSIVAANFTVPPWIATLAERAIADSASEREAGLVMSHNDINPTNLVFDGERLLLLDWETAGPNGPYYDLATAAVFFRMDDLACRQLIAAYDLKPVADLPAEFTRNRRLVAVLAGVTFLDLARRGGHAGGRDPSRDAAPSLGDCYQRLQAGTLDIASADGQWIFGLALAKQATD